MKSPLKTILEMKHRINVILTVEQYEWCVAEAKARGESTATIIREAITLMRQTKQRERPHG